MENVQCWRNTSLREESDIVHDRIVSYEENIITHTHTVSNVYTYKHTHTNDFVGKIILPMFVTYLSFLMFNWTDNKEIPTNKISDDLSNAIRLLAAQAYLSEPLIKVPFAILR